MVVTFGVLGGRLDGIFLNWILLNGFLVNRIFRSRGLFPVVMSFMTLVILHGRCGRLLRSFRRRRRDGCGSELKVLSHRISERDHALVVLDDPRVGDVERIPLRPVEGVVHERLHLIPTQHREVIDVVIDRNALYRPETVGPSRASSPRSGAPS